MNNIESLYKEIKPVDKKIVSLAQKHFDQLIKPVGSLGKLENMVSQYLGIIQEINPSLVSYPSKSLIVFSNKDNAEYLSLAKENLSPISILAKSINAKLSIIENSKTKLNVEKEINTSLNLGYKKVFDKKITNQLVGLGSNSSFKVDKELLNLNDPIKILLHFSDSELSEMVGGIFALVKNKNQIIVDGLKSCVALWIASLFNPLVLEYAFASHISTEKYHQELLLKLSLTPILKLDITQGDCEGTAFVFTVFDAGLKAYKEMDTFNDANVHEELESFTK